MDIEIVIIGESNKWVLNQPRIRIGQDSRCEVTLPAAKYPSVLGEHATLDVSDGAIKLGKGVRQGGEVFLNGHPSGIGTIVRSGDVLRLGSGGPELRIRIQEQETSTRSGDYEPTRVLYQPSSTVHDGAPPRPGPTHEATRIISASPTPTTYSPAPSAAAASGSPPSRQSYAPQGVHAVPTSNSYTPPASNISARRVDTATSSGATQVIGAQGGFGQPRSQEFSSLPAQTAAARAAESEIMQSLEGKLKTLQLILVANLAVLVLLFGWIYMQSKELSQTHREVQELKLQATNAVGALTPSLDARLNVFEKRMDVMDQRVSVAQDRMIKGMDDQAKLAEDRLANRMNAEIPAMLDKYVNKKIAELEAKKPPM
ncbi:MAG TPA: FHA domain-containing protein [Terracidiphilus sp.]|jgi:ribosomal 50S subunit-recycling heat shock protein